MMPWILSYIGSTWALILVVILLTAGLAAIAFFTHNWKSAIAAGCVLAAGFAYQQIDKNAYQRRVAEEAADQVRLVEQRLDTVNQANALHAQRSVADAQRISKLEEQANAPPPPTPPGRAVGIDRSSARRVSDIRWGSEPDEGGTAAGASRHPNLLSRRAQTAGP